MLQHTLHHSALIEADFPVIMPSCDTMVGPAKNLAEWLRAQLTERGVNCGKAEDIEYAHELSGTIDGHILTLNLSVNFVNEPNPFELTIVPPQESWWQRRRRGQREPEWKQAACELADVIHACLTSSDHVSRVTWAPETKPMLPQSTYDTPTSDVAATAPRFRWFWDTVTLLDAQSNAVLLPIVITVFVSTFATVIHPAFGLISLLAMGCGFLWFCFKMALFGGSMLLGGIEGWQRGNENGQLLWNRGIALVLIPVGVLVTGYFILLPFLLLREFLNR